jgi:hypothetical protein
VMPKFDNFVIGMERFGQRTQSLMQSRARACAA